MNHRRSRNQQHHQFFITGPRRLSGQSRCHRATAAAGKSFRLELRHPNCCDAQEDPEARHAAIDVKYSDDNDSPGRRRQCRAGTQSWRSSQARFQCVLEATGHFFADPSRSSLSDATDDLIQRLRTEDPGLRQTGNQKRAEVGKQEALITQLTSDSPFGGAETDMRLTVSRPEGLFHLVFVPPGVALERGPSHVRAHGSVNPFAQ